MRGSRRPRAIAIRRPIVLPPARRPQISCDCRVWPPGSTNERIRLGIELPPAVAAGLRSPRIIARDDGIATLTAELDEDSAVRLLSASGSAGRSPSRRADGPPDLAAGIDGERRPLAALQAQLLLVESLTAAGRATDARDELASVAAKCAELGLSRLLVDAGLA